MQIGGVSGFEALDFSINGHLESLEWQIWGSGIGRIESRVALKASSWTKSWGRRRESLEGNEIPPKYKVFFVLGIFLSLRPWDFVEVFLEDHEESSCVFF